MREAGQKAGLSLDEAAFEVGVTPAQLCRIELGTRGTTLETPLRLSYVLGWTIEELFEDWARRANGEVLERWKAVETQRAEGLGWE